MTGQKIVLADIAFTDTSLPLIRDDLILADSGSLLLMDFGHSQGGLDGLPSSGDTLPVVVGDEPAISIPYSISAPDGLLELTSKGGLHLIRSQTTNPNIVATIDLSMALENYLEANLTNSYYVSIWSKTTRAYGSTGVAGTLYLSAAAASTSPSSNNLWLINQNGVGVTAHYPSAYKNRSYAETGDNLQQLEVEGIAGAVSALTYKQLFIFGGQKGGISSPGNYGGSQVLYRIYIEDMTVSGRSFTEIKALDDELFAAAFSAGGKFYGDTYTDPATLP